MNGMSCNMCPVLSQFPGKQLSDCFFSCDYILLIQLLASLNLSGASIDWSENFFPCGIAHTARSMPSQFLAALIDWQVELKSRSMAGERFLQFWTVASLAAGKSLHSFFSLFNGSRLSVVLMRVFFFLISETC